MRRIENDDGTVQYEVLGMLYSEEDYDAMFCQLAPAASSLISFKPLHSEALAVHPNQIAEARELAKKKGVPVDFDNLGRPVFKSSRQFKKYAKAHGFHHKGY